MTTIEEKVAARNAESARKPGARVRVYTANPDGSVGVQDTDRKDAPAEFQVKQG